MKYKAITAAILIAAPSVATADEIEDLVTAEIGYAIVLEAKSIECRNEILSEQADRPACIFVDRLAEKRDADAISKVFDILRLNSKMNQRYGEIFFSAQEASVLEATKMQAVRQVMDKGLL